MTARALAPDVADGPQRRVRAGGVEGRHVVAAVGADDAREARDGAGNLGLAEEAKEAQHGETAVVCLGDQAARLLLGRRVLGELEGVEEVERHRVHVVLEGGEVARLAAAHVVLHIRRVWA